MTVRSPKTDKPVGSKLNSSSRSRTRKGATIGSRGSKKSELELSSKNLGGTKGSLELDNTLPVTIQVDGTVSPSDSVPK